MTHRQLLFWVVCLFLLLPLQQVRAQQEVLDSILKVYEETDSLHLKSRLASDIAWEYLYLNPDKTKEYSELALHHAEEADYIFGKATAYGSFGLYYDVTGDYDGAIESYRKAIKILEGYPEYEINVAANQHNLSLIFMNIEDWDKAIYYAKKALQYDIDNNKYQGQVYTYMNIAAMYGSADNLDSSLYYHRKVIEVGKKHGVNDFKIDYVNLTDIELDRRNYDSARYYLSEYLNYARHAPSSRKLNRLAYGLLSQTRLFILTQKPKEAKISADSAAMLVEQLQSPKLQVNVLENYSSYYELIKDHKKALKYYKEKENLQDSITRLELREKIEIVEARYQKEKQVNEINQLKASNEIGELKIAKSEGQRSLFLVIAILALITLAILTYLFINVQKNSRRLKAKNAIIENLIRESHHRIKNNLQVVSSLLNMQSKTVNSDEARIAINEAHHRVKTIALLHQRLQGSQDFETIPLNDFLESLSDSIVSGMASEKIEIQKDYHLSKSVVRTDKAIAIGLLVNELITNSIKYASSIGKPLKLFMKLDHDEEINLEYNDNGPGLPQDFELKQTTSLGYTIINSIIDQLNGLLNIGNKDGFWAEIKIPNEH